MAPSRSETTTVRTDLHQISIVLPLIGNAAVYHLPPPSTPRGSMFLLIRFHDSEILLNIVIILLNGDMIGYYH